MHGKEELLDRKTMNTHLHEARTLARRSLIWFLHYLDHVLPATRTDGELPSREELLSMLDLKTEHRERVGHLLRILPADFPQPSGWFEQ